MVNMGRIRRAYREAGALNSMLSLWGFADDHTFLTKAGHVGLVYRIAGIDYEGLDQSQRRELVHRYEAASRLLDDSFRVYQYLCKRRIQPVTAPVCRHPVVNDAVQSRAAYLNVRGSELYDVELFLVLVYEGLKPRYVTSTRLAGLWTQPRAALRNWLSPRAVVTLLEDDLDRAIARLHHTAAAFEVQLAESLRPARLTKGDAFRFFRRLVNYRGPSVTGAPLQYDTHLDYFVADSSVACHRTHLDVGGAMVKVLTMKEPPSKTFAHLLEDLYALSGEFIACLEWQRIPNDRMRRDLRSRQRHFHNRRVSMVNYVSSDTRPEEMLVDESAGAMVRQLGDAMIELEVQGHFFGECSLSVLLYGGDGRALERTAAEATKVLAAHDGSFVEESYNLLNAWVSIVPGNSAYNLRRLAILETHCADLSFLFNVDQGQTSSALLGSEALATFETRHHTPYHFQLHVQDVGHTLVLGATGSGKSFLLNFLAMHAQKYDPFTVIFDLGHSYRKLASLLDGSYLELGLRKDGLTINPFALEPTPEHLHFLHSFTRLLLEGTDSYRLSDAEDRELYEAVENLYVLDRSQRRLFTLSNLLPRALAGRLTKWVEGGRYAALFDHVDDTLSIHPFQVFEFEAMREYPALLEPLLFYVLHRVAARLAEPADAARLKLCVMDEAWRFIQHDRLRAYVEEALKTWRKRNAAMILATQAIDDFTSKDLLRTVVESCPTKLLLANPSLDRQQYGELFGLNDTELDLITQLMPRRQMLLKRPELAKVLSLNVDQKSYWLYTNTPGDNERFTAAVREFGLTRALERLADSL